jgi:DNA-binding transcriptional LysR family regulator
VRALEEDLGVQLLDRLGRGAAPTPAGTLLLGYANRILVLMREARQAVDRFQGRLLGELIVGGSTIPGEYILPALIGQFKTKYPDISISLRVGSSQQVSEWVEEGRVEIGVVGARPSSRVLVARELMADQMVIVVPAEHPWTRRESVTLADIRAEPLVLRERGSGTREALELALAEAGTDLAAFRVAGEMGSTQAVKQAVRAGIGVTLVSRLAVEDECRARLLVCVRVQDLDVRRSFHLVTHRDRSRSPLAQAFLEFIESQAGDRASQEP